MWTGARRGPSRDGHALREARPPTYTESFAASRAEPTSSARGTPEEASV
jgi:hypothetical protein